MHYGSLLSDGKGRLLIQGGILNILADHSSDFGMEKHIKQDPTYRYFQPDMLHMQTDGSIDHVSFSSGSSHESHAENKVVHEDQVLGITISFSPCDCCAVKNL